MSTLTHLSNNSMRLRLFRWRIPRLVRAHEAFLLSIRVFSDLGQFALVQRSWSGASAAVPPASDERPPGTYMDGAHYRVHHPHTAQESELTGHHTQGRWLQIGDHAHEKEDGCSSQTHQTALGNDIEADRLRGFSVGSSRCNKILTMVMKPRRVQYAVSAASRPYL